MNPPDHPHQGYLHEAVYYRDSAHLVTLTAPLLRQVLAQGDHVALVCQEHNNRALLEALGGDDRVAVLPRPEVYQKAVTALTYFRDFIDDRVTNGGHRVCILGEVDFGTNDNGLDEWRRYEALLNQVMSGFPLWAVCAYGTALPDPVLATAELTHPYLRRNGSRLANPDYVDPAELLRLADSGAELVPHLEPDLTIPEVLDLGELHQELSAALESAGMGLEQQQDVVVAVHELVTNGLRHGQAPVTVRVWVSPPRVVCTVTDQGSGIDDPFAGYVRGGGEPLPEGRFGLWLARQLCDDLVTARTSDGFTVRLVVHY
jgi:anti-sigma regulatory factor (Ser/Thr protein kinase)